MEVMESNVKLRLFEVIGALIAVVVLFWFVVKVPKQAPLSNSTPTPTVTGSGTAKSGASHQFLGEVQSVSGGTITVLGVHIVDANPNQTDFKDKKTAAVATNPSTRFFRTVWKTPAQAGGLIQRVTEPGSLTDLVNNKNLTITVRTSADTFNLSSFTAAEVDYNLQTK